MSRIGKKAIELPAKVSVKFGTDGAVNVEGPKGKLAWTLPKEIKAKVEGNQVAFDRTNEHRKTRALHGLSRALVNNKVDRLGDQVKNVRPAFYNTVTQD